MFPPPRRRKIVRHRLSLEIIPVLTNYCQKCDGVRPICSPCLDTPGGYEDCEYPDGGPSRMQHLEDSISRIQTRIRELQASGPDTAAPVLLYHPYTMESGTSSRAHSPATSSSHSSVGSGETYMPVTTASLDVALASSGENISQSTSPLSGPQVRYPFSELSKSLLTCIRNHLLKLLKYCTFNGQQLS